MTAAAPAPASDPPLLDGLNPEQRAAVMLPAEQCRVTTTFTRAKPRARKAAQLQIYRALGLDSQSAGVRKIIVSGVTHPIPAQTERHVVPLEKLGVGKWLIHGGI